MEEFVSKVFILIYWIVCQIVGMPLLAGLIHFEKNQGDPMKRHLIDMLLVSLFWMLITVDVVITPLLLYTVFFGPVPFVLAFWHYLGHHSLAYFACLVIVESVMIRFFIENIWKRMPLILDDFFFWFLTHWNILTCLVICIMNYFTRAAGSIVYRLAGYGAETFPKVIYRTYGGLGILVLANLAIIVQAIMTTQKKLRGWKSKRNTIGQQSQRTQQQINNQKKNEEMFNAGMQVMFFLFGMIMSVPGITTWYIQESNSTMTDPELALLDMNTFTLFSVFLPMCLYARNDKLRKHIASLLKEWMM